MGLEGETPQDSPGRVEDGKEKVRPGVGGGDHAPGNMVRTSHSLCALILQHLRQPQVNIMVLRCHFALIRVKLQYATCFAHLLIQRIFLSA